MNHHDHHPDLDVRLRAKYRSRSTDAAPPTLARRVLAIPATSPLRRGWLPWFSSGGTNLMLSATKVMASVGIIALSGALLVGIDMYRSDEGPIAGAESRALDLSSRQVSGTVSGVPTTPASADVEFGIAEQGHSAWHDARDAVVWESSDARLAGDARYAENGIQHMATWTGLRSTSWVIVNDAGSWTGTGPAFDTQAGGSGFVVLTGAGDYEGLTAYVALGPELDPDDENGAAVRGFEGVILHGDIPAQPEMPELQE